MGFIRHDDSYMQVVPLDQQVLYGRLCETIVGLLCNCGGGGKTTVSVDRSVVICA